MVSRATIDEKVRDLRAEYRKEERDKNAIANMESELGILMEEYIRQQKVEAEMKKKVVDEAREGRVEFAQNLLERYEADVQRRIDNAVAAATDKEKSKVAALQKKLRKIREAGGVNRELVRENIALREKVEEEEEETSDLEEEVEELEEQNAELEEDVEKLLERIDGMRLQIGRLRAEKDAAEAALAQHERTLEELRDTLEVNDDEELQPMVENLLDVIDESSDEITRLQVQITNLTADLAELEGLLKARGIPVPPRPLDDEFETEDEEETEEEVERLTAPTQTLVNLMEQASRDLGENIRVSREAIESLDNVPDGIRYAILREMQNRLVNVRFDGDSNMLVLSRQLGSGKGVERVLRINLAETNDVRMHGLVLLGEQRGASRRHADTILYRLNSLGPGRIVRLVEYMLSDARLKFDKDADIVIKRTKVVLHPDYKLPSELSSAEFGNALIAATKAGDKEVVELFHHTPELHAHLNENHWREAHAAATAGNHTELASMLAEHAGAPANTEEFGKALIAATKAGDKEVVELFHQTPELHAHLNESHWREAHAAAQAGKHADLATMLAKHTGAAVKPDGVFHKELVQAAAKNDEEAVFFHMTTPELAEMVHEDTWNAAAAAAKAAGHSAIADAIIDHVEGKVGDFVERKRAFYDLSERDRKNRVNEGKVSTYVAFLRDLQRDDPDAITTLDRAFLQYVSGLDLEFPDALYRYESNSNFAGMTLIVPLSLRELGAREYAGHTLKGRVFKDEFVRGSAVSELISRGKTAKLVPSLVGSGFSELAKGDKKGRFTLSYDDTVIQYEYKGQVATANGNIIYAREIGASPSQAAVPAPVSASTPIPSSAAKSNAANGGGPGGASGASRLAGLMKDLGKTLEACASEQDVTDALDKVHLAFTEVEDKSGELFSAWEESYDVAKAALEAHPPSLCTETTATSLDALYDRMYYYATQSEGN